MPIKGSELLAKRDRLANTLRKAGARCFSTIDLTKASGGATLFMECWCKYDLCMLLLVDKFGGVCTYRMTTEENDMDVEIAGIKEYFA